METSHMSGLIDFVGTLRDHFPARQIPSFDPLDGGTAAKYLFLLEAPGPKAIKTGQVSRGNPDPTARNFSRLCDSAGLCRERTILWNIIPWFIASASGGIRPPIPRDWYEAKPWLEKLIAILPNLKTIALVGKTHVWPKEGEIREFLPKARSVQIERLYHPSNQCIGNGRDPDGRRRDEILSILKKIAQS